MRVLCLLVLLTLLTPAGCRTDGAGSGPPVPASSDPTGNDLVVGSIVAAHESTGGVRLLKLLQVNFFPPPMADELVFVAYNEKGNTFQHAADLFAKGKLTVAVAKVRVYRNMFRTRDYRVIAMRAVTPADLSAKASDPTKPSTGAKR